VGGVKGDWFEDAMTLGYLRFLHKIDDSLGRNMCSNVSDMSLKLLYEINIVKDGTRA